MKVPSASEFKGQARANLDTYMNDRQREEMYAKWQDTWYFKTWQWWQLRRLNSLLQDNIKRGYTFGANLRIASRPIWPYPRDAQARLYACQTLCDRLSSLGYGCYCTLKDGQKCLLKVDT